MKAIITSQKEHFVILCIGRTEETNHALNNSIMKYNSSYNKILNGLKHTFSAENRFIVPILTFIVLEFVNGFGLLGLSNWLAV